ncbi:MAG: type II toxin-antitoxin system HicB family antitoxin [Deltaproteobacteria bacterium]|nr:type II toxin-antitoxin system HicB family antitoxin [Deltaproteobacteria bacterium]
MASYIGLLRKDPDSDFGVDFPDFPGCVTAGTTLEEAREFAVEALTLHLEGMAEGGEPIPDPTTLDVVMGDEHNRDAVAFMVDVADARANVVRVNVTFREDVLEQIDSYTKRRRMTRAGFLEEAALEKLADG